MNSIKKVLVTGATGQQGGAVTSALLKKGYQVRAITRNPSSASSEALIARGVEVVKGDFNNHASLVSAAKGVDAVFFMTTPFEAGTDAETQQGLAMVAALKEAGTAHVVFSSVGSANQNTGIPHFDSKYEVEKVLAGSGLNYSIVTPVWFMDNFRFPQSLEGVKNGVLAAAVPEKKVFQQIAVSDIGEIVAAIIERGSSEFGKRYDLAGENSTGPEYTAKLAGITGKNLAYMALDPEAYRAMGGEDFVIMVKWFGDVGYSTDISALQRAFPEVKLKGFKDWAAGHSWN